MSAKDLLKKRQEQNVQTNQVADKVQLDIKKDIEALKADMNTILDVVIQIKKLLEDRQNQSFNDKPLYSMSNNGSSWYSFYLDGNPVLDDDGEAIKIQGKDEAQAYLDTLNKKDGQ